MDEVGGGGLFVFVRFRPPAAVAHGHRLIHTLSP